MRVSGSQVYPQTLKHSPNGRLVCVCGDGEWIIYTVRRRPVQSLRSFVRPL